MQTYDAKKVNVILDGEFVVGFMDGTFVTTARNADYGVAHVGAKGEVSFSETADESGIITLNLKQDSASLPLVQRLARNKQTFPTQVIDNNFNNYQAGGTQCRILTAPGREFGAEIGGVEVQIYVGDYTEK